MAIESSWVFPGTSHGGSFHSYVNVYQRVSHLEVDEHSPVANQLLFCISYIHPVYYHPHPNIQLPFEGRTAFSNTPTSFFSSSEIPIDFPRNRSTRQTTILSSRSIGQNQTGTPPGCFQSIAKTEDFSIHPTSWDGKRSSQVRDFFREHCGSPTQSRHCSRWCCTASAPRQRWEIISKSEKWIHLWTM